MRSSINCSTVICSPTIDYAILREATSETYGPQVFCIILFSDQLAISVTVSFAIFTFQSIYQKYQKYLLYHLSISIRSHFCEWPWRDWQILYRVGCKDLIVCGGTRWLVCRLLLDWYLGSQNWGKYLRYFVASPFPLQRKTNTCSRGSMIHCQTLC